MCRTPAEAAHPSVATLKKEIKRNGSKSRVSEIEPGVQGEGKRRAGSVTDAIGDLVMSATPFDHCGISEEVKSDPARAKDTIEEELPVVVKQGGQK